jgi:gluconate 5-dehydrogenase
MDVALRSLLVTGASSGIGAALAPRLAERGCEVVVSGRDRDRLAHVAGASRRITGCAGDVTDPVHRDELVRSLSELPGPRGVIHLAGYFQTGMLDRLDATSWRRSFDVNVEARWALSRDLAHLLDGGGRLLFIGSDAGSNPRVGAAAYSIAQAASDTLRRALQAEWAGSTRAVGSFRPGLVDTEMVRRFMALSEHDFPARASYDEYVSAGRIASPDAIARFATWLLLDVPTDRFTATDWDVRDRAHHEHWAVEPLYPSE